MNPVMFRAMADEVTKIANASMGYGAQPGMAQAKVGQMSTAMRPKAPPMMNAQSPAAPMLKTAGPVWNGVKRNTQKSISAFGTPIQSLKAGGRFLKNDWNSGFVNKAMLGVGTVMGVPEAVKKVDPTGQGRSRVQRVSQFIGSQAGGIIGMPYGMSGGITASVIGDTIGKHTGRAIDKVRGYRPMAAQPVVPSPPSGA